MPIGVVRLWLPDQGFGFIAPEHGSRAEVYVHATAFKASGLEEPAVGARFKYKLEPDPRRSDRMRATDLAPVT